jgi:CRISPR-associated protein Cmr2
MQNHLLKFQIGPVQDFIAQARSTRDLWAGSWLLSRLARTGIEKLVSHPTAELVYPEIDTDQDPLAASTPNLFLARITGNAETVEKLAGDIEKFIHDEWGRIAEEVHRQIANNAALEGWDAHWNDQVKRFPVVDWIIHSCVSDAEVVRQLGCNEPPLPLDRPRFERPGACLDGLHIAMADWFFAARKNARTFAPWSGFEIPKDHLDGHREVMGGKAYKIFWDNLRENDEFKMLLKGKQEYGALTMIKRLMPRAYLKEFLRLNPWQPSFDSVQDIAEAIDAEDGEVSSKAPKYYAILAMDGDDMGQWVSGCKGAHGDLDPLMPGYHAKLSGKLASFASTVPEIVAKHRGQLVYCGGDDVFAMLPAVSALGCAEALAHAFSECLPGATASVGIAIGHVRSPLQETIQAARDAEKQAKRIKGKAGFCLRILKRSGESVEIAARWKSGVAGVWADLAARRDTFSRGFAYKLAARLADLYACWESGNDHGWAPGFTDTLRSASFFELEHSLRRQAGLDGISARNQAEIWHEPLMKLSPRDCLHFWNTWAFLLRADEPTEEPKLATPNLTSP